MAVSFLQRSVQLSRYFKRYAGSVSAVPLTDPVQDHSLGISATPTQTAECSDDVQITTLPNGVTVASRNNLLPYSSLAVYVKCGSRVESYDQQGLTHFLRDCAFLSTEQKTAFVLQREVDFVGADLSCSTTREHVIYSANCLRNHQQQVLAAIGDVICNPAFIHYEVSEQWPHVKLDTLRAGTEPDTVVFEALHKSAFRSGLGNSLYCPIRNVSKFTNQDLKEFWKQWFIGPQITVAGVGIDHSSLVEYTKSSLSNLAEGINQSVDKASYSGGNELRIETNSSSAHVGIVCKGTNLYSSSEPIAGVVEYLLGGGPRVKWGSGSATARLNKAVATKVDAPFAVTALNVRYSDNGLFGFTAVADGAIVGEVLVEAMKEFSEIGKGAVTENDLLRAKNQYKAELLMNSERQSCTVDIGTQVSLTGSYRTVQEQMKAVDSVTVQDVIAFIKTVFATRPALVAYGNLSATPKLDELLSSGISFK